MSPTEAQNRGGPLGRAFELAFAAHAGQTDKSGAPYIAHVVRVATRLDETEDQVVALLHDTVEDCGTLLSDIESAFGSKVADAVDAISKRDGEALDSYVARVCGNEIAKRVKHADLDDNSHPARMAQLDQEAQARLTAKYARTRALLQRAENA